MNAVTCGACFIGSLHMNGSGGQTHIATYVMHQLPGQA